MDKNQQESRRSATNEFISSLDTLKAVLRSNDAEKAPPKAANLETQVPPKSAELFKENDLETLLDDAVQDIERYMSEHPQE
ncbi:MAG: hypothetical protein AAGE59_13190 [Cyanobacteria bacterium P01_F01_bin.86]